MPSRKPNAAKIERQIDSLQEQSWIKRTERRWWPQFVYHYTDVRNAVNILKDEALLCRNELEINKHLEISSGSSEVLSGTKNSIKDYVRLYFRPKTPTQFHTEGIRTKDFLASSQFSDAHCPVPVFFLLDSKKVITRSDCRFSNGNMASSRHRILSSYDDFSNLPWKKIYHTGSFNRDRQDDIIFHRNAEVVVPNRLELTLDTLSYIFCRSEAEKETLIHLLPASARRKYYQIIQSTSRSDLYYRQYSFIERVKLTTHEARIYFSPDSRNAHPFELRVDINDGQNQYYLERNSYSADSSLVVTYPQSLDRYSFKVTLDDHLAYANFHVEIDLPF